MNREKLVYETLDDTIGFESGCDFNEYENKDAVLQCAIETIEEHDELTQGCGVGPLMGYIQKWVDDFEKQTNSGKKPALLQEPITYMSSVSLRYADREKVVYETLDENLGFTSGCDFNEYDSKESLLQTAIETIELEDDLTQGCGVGPLMGYIEKWIDDFEKETHNGKKPSTTYQGMMFYSKTHGKNMHRETVVYEILDRYVGFGCGADFNEYENKKHVSNLAKNIIKEHTELIKDCDIESLVVYIDKWTDNFEKETLRKKNCKKM